MSETATANPPALTPTTSTTLMESVLSSDPDESSTTAPSTSVHPAILTSSTSLNTVTLRTSSATTSSTLVLPALTSSQAPAISPQTPPPDPNSSSPDPSSRDQPGADPAPPAQSSRPNAQTTLPVVSAASSIAGSADPQRSQQPVASGSQHPAATSSGAAISSIASPLTISAVPSSPSLISIPGSNPSGTFGNPNASGQTGGSAGDVDSSSNGPAPTRKAAVAGGIVGGVVGGLFLLAIIFFLFRKCRRGGLRFRRRSVGSPLLNWNGGPRSSSKLAGRIGRVAAMLNVEKFMRRGPPSVYEGPTPSPIFSAMARRSDSPATISPRRRSWSAPAPTFRERLQSAIPVIRNPAQSAVTEKSSPSISQDPPKLPPLFLRTNGSVSSIAHAVYSPEPDSENNPFRDPDPDAPLRIINSDPSRHGTPSGTPVPTNKISFFPQLQSKPPAQPVQLHHAQPQAQNPFNDPTNEVIPSNPVRSTRPFSPSNVARASSHRRPASISSAHSNRSSVGPLPQIAALQPQQQSHVAQLSTNSADSGFVSADVSPISPQNRFEPPARNYQSTTLYPSSAAAYPSTARSSWTFDINNFGEPGLTRPNTSIFDGTGRISDPFDLDRPEVLGFMSPATGKQSIVGSSNSIKRKTASSSDWPITGTIRPVQE